MKRAIISDIHGNLEALEAVLEDIDRQRVDAIDCLGDIVGYGPNPCECVKLVRERCEVVILGNHDQGALFDPDGFNVGAERAIRWTRGQLEQHDRLPRNAADQLTDFLGELPRNHVEGDFLFVHGSARRPLDEYVFPEDIYNPLKMEHIFELIGRYLPPGAHAHSGRVHGVAGVPLAERARRGRGMPRAAAGRQGDGERRVGGAAARWRPAGLLRDRGG